MAKRRNFLSDSDVTTLRRLIADVGTLRAQIRTLHERDGKQKRGGAHYLMKAPSGGVPAASGTPSEPGSADCLIQYREGDPKTIHDTTRPEVVYNATGTPISGNALFLAHRDSWGDLWAESVANCPDIGLAPGSYRATAGATIAPGETGPIQVSGGDDCAAVIVDAVNHSECTFYLGERITAHIDKCCTAWFTGCSCCGLVPSPPDCCERSIVICIAGERQILAVDGGTYTWNVSECCDCVGATLQVTLSCTPGSGEGPGNGPGPGGNSTITAAWTYTCDSVETSGTIDVASLCVDDADVEILGELDGICNGLLNDRWANFVEDCEPCGTLPACTCCFDLQAFTVGDNCDKSDVPGTVDDVGLTAVTSSTDPVCNGGTTTVTLTYTNNSGGDYGGGADPIRFDLTSTVASAADRPSCLSASDGGTITDDAVGKGFIVEWPMPGTWANGATVVRSLVMQNNGCTPGVSVASAQVYAGRGYICTVVWNAVSCP